MRGAEAEGIIYMIPTLSGCSFDDIVNARVSKDSPMFFQLYVNQVRRCSAGWRCMRDFLTR